MDLQASKHAKTEATRSSEVHCLPLRTIFGHPGFLFLAYMGAEEQLSLVAPPSVTPLMNIDALRGSVAPKPHALARTACFILKAPCLGD